LFWYKEVNLAVTYLQKSQGNNSSTTLASGVTDSSTSFPLTSDTLFGGEGFVIIDEGLATEELAYATTKSGGALTIPLANRGLEGGSAQGHSTGASVKGVLSSAMWNNIIATLKNGFSATDGTVDTTKLVTHTATQTLTNKRITPRVVKTTDDATSVIDVDTTDQYELSAVANATTFTTSGTPVDGQKLIVRITDAGVTKALTWTGFTAKGATPPANTTAGKTHYVGFIYSATDSTWDCVAALVEA